MKNKSLLSSQFDSEASRTLTSSQGHLSRMLLMREIVFLFAMIAFMQCAKLVANELRSPNILFILADDLGWGDLGCYGNPNLDTPALDSLASEGVRFTACYSPSSLCAPARASILTGRYNHRTGAVDVPSNRGLDRIDLSERTFGDYFRHADYATALIGKWHNGAYCEDYLPHRRGFDLFHGFPNGGQDYWKWNLLRNDQSVMHDGSYLTDTLNDEAIRFIRANHSKPFAIFLAHHAPHSPLQAPDSFVKKYRDRLGASATEAVVVTYAMIEAMDAGLDRVFRSLKDLGLWENTVIVFTSDNGPVLRNDALLGSQKRFNGVFRGEKESNHEGGIRVPGLMAWPRRIAGGRVLDTPVHGIDWLPTLYGLTNGKPLPDGKPFDGLDLMPILLGNSGPDSMERSIYFQRNRYAPSKYSNAAVREGRWKVYWPGEKASLSKDSGRDNPSYQRGLVRLHWEMPLDRQLNQPTKHQPPTPFLFDLDADPGEHHDLAMSQPTIVELLQQKYDTWFDSVDADWQHARANIIAHDRSYWKNRPVPNPTELFRDFWQWKNAPVGTDPTTADPLRVFQGYWTNDAATK